jgi:peptidylprolyl isomerase
MTNMICLRFGKPVSIVAAVFALFCMPTKGIAQSPQRPLQAAPARPTRPPPQAPVQPATPAMAPVNSASDEVVARVGDANLSASDIRDYIATLSPRDQAAVLKDPALLTQAVRLLLADRLVLQETQAKKWDQQPKVAARLERVRQAAVVELYLASVSTPPSDYPSDEDLQKVYDANRDSFLMPRQFQVAQIFIPLAKNADNATEEKAKKSVDEIQRKLKAPGADFAAIANEYGVANGGDLGWLVETQIRPEVRSQLVGLAKGASSEPVRLDDGWHILKLSDTKASYTRTLPEMREQLVQQMRAERAKVLRQAYLAELTKRNPPILNEIALAKIFSEQTAASR